MKKYLLIAICFVSLNSFGYAAEFKNFTSNGVEYVWDEEESYEAGLAVYLAAFRKLYAELQVEKSEEHFKEAMKHEMELAHDHSDYIHWVIAKKEGQIIGVGMFEFLNYPEVYVREIAVLPEFQRQGIGTQLTFAPLRSDSDIQKITLVTRHVNKPAVEFYKALGFDLSAYMHPEYDPAKYCGMEWVNTGVLPLYIAQE
jgi:ribosomal protein S18 acetylase RimI-like enzyme